MQTLAEISSKRIEEMLCQDKTQNFQNSKKMLCLLESDLYALLKNYFILKGITIKHSFENGEYIFDIKIKATQIKDIGFCI